LKLYPLENPSTSEEKRNNIEIYDLAEKILSIRKAEFYQGKFILRNDKKGQITFMDYYKRLKEERFETKANYGN
tara:strand:+ start:14541 stop:14762 length:222 start_codon:yes stop_codon:yes gene_type:complete